MYFPSRLTTGFNGGMGTAGMALHDLGILSLAQCFSHLLRPLINAIYFPAPKVCQFQLSTYENHFLIPVSIAIVIKISFNFKEKFCMRYFIKTLPVNVL
jgi:hypothetical protein